MDVFQLIAPVLLGLLNIFVLGLLDIFVILPLYQRRYNLDVILTTLEGLTCNSCVIGPVSL